MNSQEKSNQNINEAPGNIPRKLHCHSSQKLSFKGNKSSPLITKNSLHAQKFHMVVHNKLNRKLKKFSNKILRNLNSNSQLSSLTFHYAYYHSKELSFVSHMLKHLRKTNSLQLRIMNDTTSLERVNELARSLRFLPALRYLDFTIPYSNPSNITQFQLTKTLKTLKELTSLSLNSGWGSSLHVDKICEGLKTMKKLTSLNLFFSCSGLKNTDAVILADSISQLKELRHLTLDLSRNEISLEGLDAIIQSLQNLTQLQELDLIFNNNLILAESFGVFKNSMQTLTQLQSLNLNLSNIKIFKDSLKDLGEGIGYLENLKVLKIGMLDCHLNEKHIINLGKGISALKSLTELDLDFTNNQLYDKETLEFIECLRDIKEIRKFSLSLSKNLIGDWVLMSISKVLGNYRNLEEVSLNAFGCRLSDKGIGGLSVLPERLFGLKELVLLFSKNRNIKEEGVSKLMDSLPSIKGLREIRIDLAECQLSEDIEERYIKKFRDELPNCNSTILFSH